MRQLCVCHAHVTYVAHMAHRAAERCRSQTRTETHTRKPAHPHTRTPEHPNTRTHAAGTHQEQTHEPHLNTAEKSEKAARHEKRARREM